MNPDDAHILQVSNVCFAYPGADRDVLRDASFSARTGEMLAILGPNGSGKTTLLKCLLRVLKPRSGKIVLDGEKLSKHSTAELARLQAYVPQTPQSAFAFTARQVVMLGRTPHMSAIGFETTLDHRIVKAAMEMTDTLRFASRTLDELSGGEAQRVMIARALAQQPSIMLLDEPTSHLDIKNELLIYRMMHRLAHEWKMAVVCVSHDINLAGRFADRLVLLGDGAVAAKGVPSEVLKEETLENVYDVKVRRIDSGDDQPPMVVVD